MRISAHSYTRPVRTQSSVDWNYVKVEESGVTEEARKGYLRRSITPKERAYKERQSEKLMRGLGWTELKRTWNTWRYLMKRRPNWQWTENELQIASVGAGCACKMFRVWEPKQENIGTTRADGRRMMLRSIVMEKELPCLRSVRHYQE